MKYKKKITRKKYFITSMKSFIIKLNDDIEEWKPQLIFVEKLFEKLMMVFT